MTVKRIKPSSSQRTAKRLQEQVAANSLKAQRNQHAFEAYQRKAEQLMDAASAQVGQMKDVLITNNIKITELENQVANQYRENAALRQDLEANSKRNLSHVREIGRMRNEADDALNIELNLRMQLDEAKTRISYRIYKWFVARVERLKEVLAIRKQRMVNAWKIHRLNRARVEALNEAGYIPEKLIKVAHQYWEEDKARATETIVERDGYGNDTIVRQTPLRRLKIMLGSA